MLQNLILAYNKMGEEKWGSLSPSFLHFTPAWHLLLVKNWVKVKTNMTDISSLWLNKESFKSKKSKRWYSEWRRKNIPNFAVLEWCKRSLYFLLSYHLLFKITWFSKKKYSIKPQAWSKVIKNRNVKKSEYT